MAKDAKKTQSKKNSKKNVNEERPSVKVVEEKKKVVINEEKKPKPIVEVKKEVKEKKNNEKVINTLNKIEDNRKGIILFVIGFLIATLLFRCILWPDRIATLKDGTQPVANVLGEDITADELYEDMKQYYSVKVLLNKIDNKILEENIIPEGYEEFASTLKKMNELAHLLRKNKTERGYIDFDLDEAKIVQDENGKAIDVIKRQQLDGEKLIEDFMIAANETVATHIYNMDLPFVYRIHGKPNPEKIEDFVNFVKLLGYKLDVSTEDITPKKMQDILDSLHEKKEFEILSDMLLRSMKKAVYSSNNIGHFGLASKIYTHFTSPIRRFPDLMVHTLLHKYLFENMVNMPTIRYYENYLPDACEHASKKEVDAQSAEREVLDMKMAEYMESHIGQEYTGIISGVTNFGLFVKLPNLIEGLVHISTLKGFCTYVPNLLSLVSDGKIRYSLGQQVKVRVTGASKENSTIDFEIIGDTNDRDKK